MKVLLLRGGAVGDCVVTTPTVGLVRRHLPDAHITLVGDPYSIGVFGEGEVDRFLPIGRWDIRNTLKLTKERFDLTIDLHNNGRSRFQSLLSRASRRIGFQKHALQQLSYTECVPFPKETHAVERYAALTAPLGIRPARSDIRLHVPISTADRTRAHEIVSGLGVDRYAILVPTTGGERPAWRRWPAASFAKLASDIHRTLSVPLLVPSMPSQAPIVDDIASRAPGSVIPFSEPIELRTLTALIAGSEFYFGYNTGAMHLAAAHDVPVAAFFDISEDVVEWHPWTTAPYRMIEPHGSCSHPKCRGQRCLHTVSVDEALAAVGEVYRSSLAAETNHHFRSGINSAAPVVPGLRHRMSIQG